MLCIARSLLEREQAQTHRLADQSPSRLKHLLVSAESLPSNAVTPVVANVQDLAITMTSPASVNAGSLIAFTMVASHGGPGNAANVTLTDTIPSIRVLLRGRSRELHRPSNGLGGRDDYL